MRTNCRRCLKTHTLKQIRRGFMGDKILLLRFSVEMFQLRVLRSVLLLFLPYPVKQWQRCVSLQFTELWEIALVRLNRFVKGPRWMGEGKARQPGPRVQRQPDWRCPAWGQLPCRSPSPALLPPSRWDNHVCVEDYVLFWQSSSPHWSHYARTSIVLQSVWNAYWRQRGGASFSQSCQSIGTFFSLLP